MSDIDLRLSPAAAQLPAPTPAPVRASASSTTVAGVTADSGPIPIPVEDGLPLPPSDGELYHYLGPQHRWVIVVMSAASTITLATMCLFALRSWWFYPLLAFLAVSFVGVVFSAVTSTRRRRVTRETHEALLGSALPAAAPSVDVFLPTCGEPIELLANTYRHVTAMRWPGRVEVHVLDDAAREEVELLAMSFGFDYVVRPDRGHLKKAGNLQHAYQRTSGDLIAIFDADFVPRADFLHHLVPYFDDPSIGIVQSPQTFETSSRMNWLQRGAGATQELFYRWIQPSRDALGAAICVGTSALYRRAALDANGGFARIDHSEDVFTGIQLQGHGYGLRYVPVLLSRGVCPDDVAAFISQQYRWCLGSVGLVASKEFRRAGLSAGQWLAHLSGLLFYVTTAMGVLLAELPGVLALLLFASTVQPWQFLGLIPALWVKLVLMPVVSRSSVRLEVQRVETVYSIAHVVAIVDSLRGKVAAWVPTSAGVAVARVTGKSLVRRVAILGCVVLVAFLALLVAAIVRAAAVTDFGVEHLWFSALLGGLFAYTTLPVLGLLIPIAAGRVPRLRTARRSGSALTAAAHHLDEPMLWPEATAWTAALVLLATVAAFTL